jgi:phosphatidylglycerol:prolipoprotein diacylglycerol transferase
MIEIGMNPFLFTVGSFTLSWHGLMTGLAVLVAVIVAARLARGTGIRPEEVYSTALVGIVGGVIGARMFHVIDKWGEIYSQDPWLIVRGWGEGLSLYGALIGGFVFGITYAAIRKLPLGTVVNIAAPAMVLAQAIGRIGCIINGDAYGTPTSLPWGVIYTNPNAAASTILGEPARHPVPAYELIFDLLIFALLLFLRKRVVKGWMLFLIYAPLYSAGRFLLSFIRGDEAAVLGPLHQSQVVSLIVIAVCVPLLIWIARRPAPPSTVVLSAASDQPTNEPKADSS